MNPQDWWNVKHNAYLTIYVKIRFITMNRNCSCKWLIRISVVSATFSSTWTFSSNCMSAYAYEKSENMLQVAHVIWNKLLFTIPAKQNTFIFFLLCIELFTPFSCRYWQSKLGSISNLSRNMLSSEKLVKKIYRTLLDFAISFSCLLVTMS